MLVLHRNMGQLHVAVELEESLFTRRSSSAIAALTTVAKQPKGRKCKILVLNTKISQSLFRIHGDYEQMVRVFYIRSSLAALRFVALQRHVTSTQFIQRPPRQDELNLVYQLLSSLIF